MSRSHVPMSRSGSRGLDFGLPRRIRFRRIRRARGVPARQESLDSNSRGRLARARAGWTGCRVPPGWDGGWDGVRQDIILRHRDGVLCGVTGRNRIRRQLVSIQNAFLCERAPCRLPALNTTRSRSNDHTQQTAGFRTKQTPGFSTKPTASVSAAPRAPHPQHACGATPWREAGGDRIIATASHIGSFPQRLELRIPSRQ